ncbi:MAG: TatD family deoxyribonuclease [Myxococcales bacterium]|nr:TatD family deoxyribonuclease [Myxococcales bacterium]
MFDSHCHLHDRRIGHASDLLARARAAGVRGLLLAGVDPEGWDDEDRLARAHTGIAVAYGVHPQVVAEVDDEASERMVAALAALLDGKTHFAPAAIGEIGLDALGERKGSLPRQERAFRAQLALAHGHALPVILHILRAHGPAVAVLREGPPVEGVVHSYSGSADLVADYVGLGLHLSFAGPVTFANARRQREAVRAVPRDRLLVETDAPDQTPEPHRTEQNEPAFLPAIIEAVARIREEPAAEVAAYTEANARRLFHLPS